MNLFRSEEHVKNWSQYNTISAESIMPISGWAHVFSGALFRKRLEPDYLAHLAEYASELMGTLGKLGKSGSFWTPQQTNARAA